MLYACRVAVPLSTVFNFHPVNTIWKVHNFHSPLSTHQHCKTLYACRVAFPLSTVFNFHPVNTIRKVHDFHSPLSTHQHCKVLYTCRVVLPAWLAPDVPASPRFFLPAARSGLIPPSGRFRICE
jgi:hypothetical protein